MCNFCRNDKIICFRLFRLAGWRLHTPVVKWCRGTGLRSKQCLRICRAFLFLNPTTIYLASCLGYCPAWKINFSQVFFQQTKVWWTTFPRNNSAHWDLWIDFWTLQLIDFFLSLILPLVFFLFSNPSNCYFLTNDFPMTSDITE